MVQNNLHQKALALRLEGKSYGEMKRKLNIPKSTLSSWFKNFVLPLSAQKILEEKRMVPRKQLMEFNRRRTRIIQAENNAKHKKAVNEIKKLSKYELLLVGAVLYWAEGYKRQNEAKTPQIDISNSDPSLISVFLRFLREILKVPEEKLRPKIFLHPNINRKKAIKFWAKVTKIPKENFAIANLISRASQKKRPLNFLPYGTLDLRVNSRQNFYQIKGWIDGLIRQA